MNLQAVKLVHMVGIKGQGMTALAEILAHGGVEITGSDGPEVFSTDAVLKDLGIAVRAFDAELVPRRADAVIYSSAYKESHEELVRAREWGIPTIPYAQALA